MTKDSMRHNISKEYKTSVLYVYTAGWSRGKTNNEKTYNFFYLYDA